MSHRRTFAATSAGLMACLAAIGLTVGASGAQAAPTPPVPSTPAATKPVPPAPPGTSTHPTPPPPHGPRAPYATTTYEVARESAYGTNRYTVYRPADPAKVGRPLPVVVWSPGACNHDSNSDNRNLLTGIAAHGLVVVSEGSVDGSSTGQASGSPDVAILTGGITWAEHENARKGSVLEHRLDLGKVAAAGHSCGGLEALLAGADPRVKAVVSYDSGFFADGTLGYDRSELAKIHGPVLFLDGGPDDVAYANTRANYDLITKYPAVLAENAVAGHGGIVAGNEAADGALGAVNFLDVAFNRTPAARNWVTNVWKTLTNWTVATKNGF